MSLYSINGALKIIKEKKFKLEREIQTLVENNLNELLNLEFVRTEFPIENRRIDTLAYDRETKSFVIIEFKRDKNSSVIDQGYTYLSLMLNNKADFILEFNEIKEEVLKRKDVDWSQSRVIFISQNFTEYQRESINFKDLPIELWEINRFENDTISFNQIQKTKATESIKTISNPVDEYVEKVNKEIKVYTEEEHIKSGKAEAQELYQKLKAGVFNFDDDIKVKAKKQTVDFRIGNNIFCDVQIQNKGLKLFLNLKRGNLKDPENITRDVSSIGHWGNGDYEIKLENDENLEYILSLIKQSFRINRK